MMANGYINTETPPRKGLSSYLTITLRILEHIQPADKAEQHATCYAYKDELEVFKVVPLDCPSLAVGVNGEGAGVLMRSVPLGSVHVGFLLDSS
jgi:hypothetical protein